MDNIIKYLNEYKLYNTYKHKPKRKLQSEYNNTNCYNIDGKRREILDIWSNIIQHFINLIIGIAFAYFLYFYVITINSFNAYNIKLFDCNSIKCHINYWVKIK